MTFNSNFVFDDLGHFKEYCQVVGHLLLGLIRCVPHDQTGIKGLGDKTYRGKMQFSLDHIKGT